MTEQITIEGKQYTITLLDGSIEVEVADEVTGLNTVYVWKDLRITPQGITTTIYQYQITPTRERIAPNIYNRQTTQEDFDSFKQSPLASPILKSVCNGIFRFIIGNTDKVFDESGNLITEQPFRNSETDPLIDIDINL